MAAYPSCQSIFCSGINAVPYTETGLIQASYQIQDPLLVIIVVVQ